MKKIISFFFVLITFLFCIFQNSLDDDYAYLETLFSDVAIDMSLSLDEKKLTAKDVITEIKTTYKETASSKKEKKEGIDKKAFASAISEIYAKYSNTCGHTSVFNVTGDDFFMPFTHQYIYYSDIYFTKENDSYIVYKNYKNIKKGMRYTGSVDNIFKTIHDEQTLFTFGTFSSGFLKTSIISIDNKDYEIPVTGSMGKVKNSKDYDFKKIDNSIYLKIEKCNFSDESKEKQFLDDSKNIIKEFSKADNIIFDLRDNLGGFSKYVNQFLCALIYDEQTNENDLEFNKWHTSLYAGEKRINTKTMIDKTVSKGLAPSSYINFCRENLETKYLDDVEDEEITLFPYCKGKIYVIMNPLTCSAAEEFVLNLKEIFDQNVITIGQNSQGGLDFTDVYKYVLPNSKIRLKLCAVDMRDSKLLTNKYWLGDTKGIYPDYWCKPNDVVKILSFLMGNESMSDYIKL